MYYVSTTYYVQTIPSGMLIELPQGGFELVCTTANHNAVRLAQRENGLSYRKNLNGKHFWKTQISSTHVSSQGQIMCKFSFHETIVNSGKFNIFFFKNTTQKSHQHIFYLRGNASTSHRGSLTPGQQTKMRKLVVWGKKSKRQTCYSAVSSAQMWYDVQCSIPNISLGYFSLNVCDKFLR